MKKNTLQKSLGAVIAAILLVIGVATGIIPMDEGAVVADTAAQVQQVNQTQAPKTQATQTPRTEATEAPEEEAGPIIEPQAIADYLFEHGRLPDNFITKAQARELGWDNTRNDVSDVAPGMSIGGDRFGNYEGLLPTKKGRQYYEADCYYTGGNRGAHRIVYSNDGLVFYTADHYESFVEMKPSGR